MLVMPGALVLKPDDTPGSLKRKGTAPTVPYPEVVSHNESILANAPTLAMEPPAMEDLVSA